MIPRLTAAYRTRPRRGKRIYQIPDGSIRNCRHDRTRAFGFFFFFNDLFMVYTSCNKNKRNIIRKPQFQKIFIVYMKKNNWKFIHRNIIYTGNIWSTYNNFFLYFSDVRLNLSSKSVRAMLLVRDYIRNEMTNYYIMWYTLDDTFFPFISSTYNRITQFFTLRKRVQQICSYILSNCAITLVMVVRYAIRCLFRRGVRLLFSECLKHNKCEISLYITKI